VAAVHLAAVHPAAEHAAAEANAAAAAFEVLLAPLVAHEFDALDACAP
jgi:hypothetical protein